MLIKVKFQVKDTLEFLGRAHYADKQHLNQAVDYLHRVYGDKYNLVMEEVLGTVDFSLSEFERDSERESLCGLGVHPEDIEGFKYIVAGAFTRGPVGANTFSDLAGNSFHLSDFRIKQLKVKLEMENE